MIAEAERETSPESFSNERRLIDADIGCRIGARSPLTEDLQCGNATPGCSQRVADPDMARLSKTSSNIVRVVGADDKPLPVVNQEMTDERDD